VEDGGTPGHIEFWNWITEEKPFYSIRKTQLRGVYFPEAGFNIFKPEFSFDFQPLPQIPYQLP